jgi:hypothetical protein
MDVEEAAMPRAQHAAIRACSALRGNTDYCFMLKCIQSRQLEALWEDFGSFLTKDGFARLLDAHTEDNECLVVNTYPVECDVAEAIDCHPCSIPKESSQVQKRSSLFSHVMPSVG